MEKLIVLNKLVSKENSFKKLNLLIDELIKAGYRFETFDPKEFNISNNSIFELEEIMKTKKELLLQRKYEELARLRDKENSLLIEIAGNIIENDSYFIIHPKNNTQIIFLPTKDSTINNPINNYILDNYKDESMYKQNFINLVNEAVLNSVDIKNEPNPFYIGFGNPNAPILIVGKEKGFSIDDIKGSDQLKRESTDNPMHWKEIISNPNFKIEDAIGNHKHGFKNPLYPYTKVSGSGQGQTWCNYNKLVINLLNKNITDNPNNTEFLLDSFITEMNHVPSKTSKGRPDISGRIDWLKKAFYQDFKIVILAFGDYLNNTEVEEIFNVKLITDMSAEGQKLIIYKNENTKKVVVRVRQLSNAISKDYLPRVCSMIKANTI